MLVQWVGETSDNHWEQREEAISYVHVKDKSCRVPGLGLHGAQHRGSGQGKEQSAMRGCGPAGHPATDRQQQSRGVCGTCSHTLSTHL